MKTAVILQFLLHTLLYDAILSSQTPTIQTLPDDGKVKVGSEVILRCSIPSEGAGVAQSVLWYQQYGDIKYKIGISTIGDFSTTLSISGRFSVSTKTMPNGSLSSNLTITDAHLEDSGILICGTGIDASSAQQTVLVCSDTGSKLCSCMLTYGQEWASSKCVDAEHGPQEASDDYKMATVGLGIVLAILLTYSVIMSVLASRECIHKLQQQSNMNGAMLKSSVASAVGKSTYPNYDMINSDPSDSSSEATASGSATCSSSDYSAVFDSTVHQQVLPSRWNDARDWRSEEPVPRYAGDLQSAGHYVSPPSSRRRSSHETVSVVADIHPNNRQYDNVGFSPYDDTDVETPHSAKAVPRASNGAHRRGAPVQRDPSGYAGSRSRDRLGVAVISGNLQQETVLPYQSSHVSLYSDNIDSSRDSCI